jgi:hypothetical protein
MLGTYDFDTQIEIGRKAESFLDDFFYQEYEITEATPEQQRLGVDRFFTKRDTGETFAVEYKCDYKAGKTGNAFVETVSVDTRALPGWAYTSQSEWLIYLIPSPLTIYAIRFDSLRAELPKWVQNYPKRSIPNKGYRTHGLLVPLSEFEAIADAVI